VTAEYLTEIELAERLRRSPQTIARWRKAHKAPRHRRIGGRILYPIGDVQAWEAAQAAEAGVPEVVQTELQRYATALGLNMTTSEGIQRLGRVLAEDAAREAESTDRTDCGVA
jgi:predicted DNA-binding transcriptional regulator AlpA